MPKNKKNQEKNPIHIFKKISTVFIFLSIILILLVLIVAYGIIIMEQEPLWAYLSLDNWVIIVTTIILLFAIIEIIYYLTKIRMSDKIVEFKEVGPEEKHGKKIYDFISPKDSKGGVFSKTYIKIDDENYLKLRHQIIPPEKK